MRSSGSAVAVKVIFYDVFNTYYSQTHTALIHTHHYGRSEVKRKYNIRSERKGIHEEIKID